MTTVVLAHGGGVGADELILPVMAVLIAIGIFYALRKLHQSERQWEAEDDIARQVREIDIDQDRR